MSSSESGLATILNDLMAPRARNISFANWVIGPDNNLRAQLRAYRSGSRQDPQMSIVAKTLTDGDIENLADWYSAIKVTVEMPK